MELNAEKKKLDFDFFEVNVDTKLEIPLAAPFISAGFPSPALDFNQKSIDLNKYLIKHPEATFYGRVKGFSMKDIGIEEGDLLVIDKSIPPLNGKIAVCFIDGEFTLKIIKLEKDCCWLMPANEQYKPIKVTEDNNFIIWGIVVHAIKSF